jgi:hypothetical protein
MEFEDCSFTVLCKLHRNGGCKSTDLRKLKVKYLRPEGVTGSLRVVGKGNKFGTIIKKGGIEREE